MLVRYELEITCKCPVDQMPDVYWMAVVSRRSIPVETILLIVKDVCEKTLCQEELCELLHRKINATVVLVGWHSGVRTEVVCGELE